MTDNIAATLGDGTLTLASFGFTHSGDSVQAEGVVLFGISGSEDSWTAAPINGDATEGLQVQLGPTDNAVLDAIEATLNSIQTAVEILDNAISGSEMQVDLVSAAVTNAGTFVVQEDGAALTALQAIQAAVEIIDNAISGSEMQVDIVADGADLLTNTNFAAAFGTAGSADSQVMSVQGIASMTPLLVDATGQGDVPVSIEPVTSGGCSIFYDNDLDETAVAVKASAGQVYGIYAINLTAAPLYLQLFNIAQGSVTVGTTTPTVQFVIPANADSDGAGFWLTIPQGIAFSTAITAAATTDNEGNGAPGANECMVNIFYA